MQYLAVMNRTKQLRLPRQCCGMCSAVNGIDLEEETFTEQTMEAAQQLFDV